MVVVLPQRGALACLSKANSGSPVRVMSQERPVTTLCLVGLQLVTASSTKSTKSLPLSRQQDNQLYNSIRKELVHVLVLVQQPPSHQIHATKQTTRPHVCSCIFLSMPPILFCFATPTHSHPKHNPIVPQHRPIFIYIKTTLFEGLLTHVNMLYFVYCIMFGKVCL